MNSIESWAKQPKPAIAQGWQAPVDSLNSPVELLLDRVELCDKWQMAEGKRHFYLRCGCGFVSFFSGFSWKLSWCRIGIIRLWYVGMGSNGCLRFRSLWAVEGRPDNTIVPVVTNDFKSLLVRKCPGVSFPLDSSFHDFFITVQNQLPQCWKKKESSMNTSRICPSGVRTKPYEISRSEQYESHSRNEKKIKVQVGDLLKIKSLSYWVGATMGLYKGYQSNTDIHGKKEALQFWIYTDLRCGNTLFDMVW